MYLWCVFATLLPVDLLRFVGSIFQLNQDMGIYIWVLGGYYPRMFDLASKCILQIIVMNGFMDTLRETNISLKNGILKMIFLFPRWDMLIPWRVISMDLWIISIEIRRHGGGDSSTHPFLVHRYLGMMIQFDYIISNSLGPQNHEKWRF